MNIERTPVKTIALSTTDMVGGAARAASRLHEGLIAQGVNTEMWVQRRTGTSPLVHSGPLIGQAYQYLDALPKMFYRGRQRGPWSAGLLPNPFFPIRKLRTADLVHCHWVSEGFLPLAALSRINRPIVWTLHDMAAFTGGCHYAGECQAFTNRCGRCPLLGSSREVDLSRLGIWMKERYWSKADITIVCPSRWLADQAGRSPLLKNRPITVIPNGLDLGIYKPLDKAGARTILGLPQDKILLLMVAMNATNDRRKGFPHLEKALGLLGKRAPQNALEVLVLGDSDVSMKPIGNIQIRCLGQFTDDARMALAYSSADIFVAPSEQDNLPNTVMESMACGTPSIAFDVGGMPDLIDNRVNGLLIRPFSAESLATELLELCNDKERRSLMGVAARAKTEKMYTIENISKRYLTLYGDALSNFQAKKYSEIR